MAEKQVKKEVKKKKSSGQKKNAQKYYAIKEAGNVRDTIVTTWPECEKIVHGRKAVYKSFGSKEEALIYLKNVNAEKVKEQTKFARDQKKIVKSTTTLLQTRVDKQLYEDFMKKCEEMGQDKDTVIRNMLIEWVL